MSTKNMSIDVDFVFNTISRVKKQGEKGYAPPLSYRMMTVDATKFIDEIDSYKQRYYAINVNLKPDTDVDKLRKITQQSGSQIAQMKNRGHFAEMNFYYVIDLN